VGSETEHTLTMCLLKNEPATHRQLVREMKPTGAIAKASLHRTIVMDLNLGDLSVVNNGG